MKVFQSKWESSKGWTPPLMDDFSDADLVLVFGGRALLTEPERFPELRAAFPKASLLMGSTAGEIIDEEVLDGGMVLSAVRFEHTQVRGVWLPISEEMSRKEVGEQIANQLLADDLALVFVISDGQNVNGSALVQGLNNVLGGKVPVTGGLAGDGNDFNETVVGLDAAPQSGVVAALGFYGSRLQVGYGTVGGWDTFGPERTVTRSNGNILYELDGESALTLYKEYLGERASELPGSALLFPLALQDEAGGEPLVRTVLGVDEAENSMVFAGDITQGSKARLMRANIDRLVDGAVASAALSLNRLQEFQPELAILISCVGRKLILGQRVEEEVEEVRHILGQRPSIIGFYSYGEISPGVETCGCSLYNQTMTITTLTEE